VKKYKRRYNQAIQPNASCPDIRLKKDRTIESFQLRVILDKAAPEKEDHPDQNQKS
jgi:hypothetical protein